MSATKIVPESCNFIEAGTLAKMSPKAAEAIDCFFNSDLDVSFGDANRTLIDVDAFIDMLQEAMDADDIYYTDDGNVHPGYLEIRDTLEDFLDGNLYVDLEN